MGDMLTIQPAIHTFIPLRSSIIISCFIVLHTIFSGAARAGSINIIIYNESMRNLNHEFLPISNYLNTALDSTQVPEAFHQKYYFFYHKRVFNELGNPVKYIIRDGGFQKFFYDEWITPRAISGYTLHLLGGGYDFRFVAEWFDYNGVPAPYLFSFITTYLGRIGNKAVESSSKFLTSHNNLSDLLFFDIIGNLLFLSDDVTRFFYRDFGLRNWAGIPMLNIRTMNVINCGNYYVLRPYLFNKYVRPFILMGMQYFAGLSFNIDDRYSLSFGAGIAVTKPFNPDHDTMHTNLKKVRPAGGVYFDRDGTILASLILNGTEYYKLRFNIYPELLKIEYFHTGLFLAIDDYNRVIVGINFYSVFGFGILL
jgi:hypothetical protein